MEKAKKRVLPLRPADPDKENREQERANARIALSHGAEGAAIIAGIGVTMLLLGWLLFYFCLFLRRGYVG
jgi:hypothetical protein